jgi:hypothetical protein
VRGLQRWRWQPHSVVISGNDRTVALRSLRHRSPFCQENLKFIQRLWPIPLYALVTENMINLYKEYISNCTIVCAMKNIALECKLSIYFLALFFF